MLTYEQALERISERIVPVECTEFVDISQAQNRVVARDLKARYPNPSFDNSAVDGYLIGQPFAKAGETLRVIGEIRAGQLPPLHVPKLGEAVRTFTGAPVPEGRFCIAMQEDVEPSNGSITLQEGLKEGSGIRRTASDFPVGETLIEAGARLGPAELAMAAWNGLEKLEVFAAPKVTILVTGDELVPPGKDLLPGQIHDSNGPALSALSASVTPCCQVSGFLTDDSQKTMDRIRAEAEGADLILISGGASVGDHDHIPAAIQTLGEVYFHKALIKPGQPVLFGRVGKAFVFGLPGNPASAYVCFEIFVRSALRELSGEKNPEAMWVPARFESSHGPEKRDEFSRVALETRDGKLWATPVYEQGSFGLRSLSAAHGLARLKMNQPYRQGDPVSVLLLP